MSNNMQNYQILDWDTEVLGIKTAKIIPDTLSLEALQTVLTTLKQQQVKLVYWLTASDDIATQEAAAQCHGFLADQKVTYVMDLTTVDAASFSNQGVEIYPSDQIDAQLEMLATEIGMQSRFGVDPKITHQQMEAVYKTWILNSVKKIIAKEVLVIKQDHKIVGVVTLADKNQRGDLSLVSVDPHYRGLKLGVRLVRAAQHWCLENGYSISQVVTQQHNLAACKLYEKCGYHVEKVEHFFHFWL